MGTQPGGPPNKWNVAVNINDYSSTRVLETINQQAKQGNVRVLFAICGDGNFLFFGNYQD